jgi:hypothetical protein
MQIGRILTFIFSFLILHCATRRHGKGFFHIGLPCTLHRHR